VHKDNIRIQTTKKKSREEVRLVPEREPHPKSKKTPAREKWKKGDFKAIYCRMLGRGGKLVRKKKDRKENQGKAWRILEPFEEKRENKENEERTNYLKEDKQGRKKEHSIKKKKGKRPKEECKKTKS